MISRQAFDPWGQVRAGGNVSQTSLNYTGQRKDDTGLLYYHSRYYDPLLARFTSPDTLIPSYSNPQNLNRYSYVLNNPVGRKDPTGHFACTESVRIGALDDECPGGATFLPSGGGTGEGAGGRSGPPNPPPNDTPPGPPVEPPPVEPDAGDAGRSESAPPTPSFDPATLPNAGSYDPTSPNAATSAALKSRHALVRRKLASRVLSQLLAATCTEFARLGVKYATSRAMVARGHRLLLLGYNPTGNQYATYHTRKNSLSQPLPLRLAPRHNR